MKFEIVFVGELKPDFVSRRIQRYQSILRGYDVPYSHVAVIVDGERVFDATGRGISECTLADLLDGGQAVIRERYEIEVRSECCALTWLEARQGIPYSNWQYLGYLFPILRGLPGVRNGRRGSVCSEFGADFMHSQSTKEKRFFEQREWMLPVDLRDMLNFLNVKQVSE